MLILHWSLNVVGALLMATSNPQAQDARGLIFGLMVVIVSVVILICESSRRPNRA
ncbi:hypothetical protein G9G39_22560 [Cronobacter sp. EKM101R]|uniref:hypothetical protein n=1 Tax=Cronobacter TaxID=413496 RepID=UPI0014095F0A|nr:MULTISPECIES: hypothetical protein [Cronobacter]KAF6589106.1 hypothetical protein G9G39_22560 [Cronobacter sp. EKM101R]